MITHRRPILYGSANGLTLVPNVMPLPQLWMGTGKIKRVRVEHGGDVTRYIIEGDAQAVRLLIEAGETAIRQLAEAGGDAPQELAETGETVRVIVEYGGRADGGERIY